MIATAEPTGADIAAAAAGPRGRARLAAVQALYQNDMTGASIVDVIDEFIHHRLPAESDDPTIAGADKVFFARLARGAVAQREVTDAAITAALSAGWSLSRLGRIVLAILRVGGYEILAVEGVPRAVSARSTSQPAAPPPRTPKSPIFSSSPMPSKMKAARGSWLASVRS